MSTLYFLRQLVLTSKTTSAGPLQIEFPGVIMNYIKCRGQFSILDVDDSSGCSENSRLPGTSGI